MTLTASPTCYCLTSDGSHAMNCPLRPNITVHPIPYDIHLIPYEIYPQPVLGWICPRCGAGVSPHTTNCPCNQMTVTVTWTSTILGREY